MSKHTPWFPAEKVKPVRKGLYEWQCYRVVWGGMVNWDSRRFTYVNGRKLRPCPDCRWRGLTRPAEES